VATALGATSRCASQRSAHSLFNGTDLTGWHVDVPAADSNVRVRSPFLVRNGMLVTLGEPRGHLIIALYNRHWSSKLWLLIKLVYCKSPKFLQRLLIWTMYPVIYVAKWIVTGSNPRNQLRGMDFYFDVIDWVGGYPYEYASREEVLTMVEPLGFTCIRYVPSQVPTGCNEFIFRKR